MSNQKIGRNELAKHLATTLDINRFRDYCPNGLQVEGRDQIGRLVTGVTASMALLEAAHDTQADAVLVHHGYFWRGEDARVIGPHQRRLKLLLTQNINLFAYHLPLDAHPVLGNNAQLGIRLGLTAGGHFGDQELGWLGTVDDPELRIADLAQRVEQVLGRSPTIIGNPQQRVGLIGWCTGAAQNALADAISAGAHTYLSGEISEQTVHLARESGVAYLACGHHATERYGVQAIGEYLAREFNLHHEFIDISNPV
jgi:dinuclear metal center YbgI/SA1388 family protein